jgi:ubiquitin C-terminal hydrolase
VQKEIICVQMQKYNDALIPKPFGLMNTGVVCYFNSFLQTLCSCSSFTSTVMKNKEYLLKTMTGAAIYNYVNKYINVSPTDEFFLADEVRPEIAFSTMEILKALKSDLRERRPKINFGNGQESAHEVFVLLLDMMEPVDSETENYPLLSSINSPITKLFLHKCEWNLYCISCKKSISKKIDYGVIFDMHHIDMQSNTNTPSNFSKLIKQHVSSVEGYKCPTCSSESICRIYNLKRIPEIVFCSFNIYYQENRKIRYFPPYLEFKTNHEDDKYTFKLISQIEHSGSLNGGHYWAKCLRSENRVYELNDMGLAPTMFQSTPHTYMIIYHIV